VKFQRGHDLTVQNICNGDYPVAGSNGIIGYHDAFTTQGPGVTLGRSGNSIGVVHYYNKNFWAHNTTLYSTEFIDSYPKYIYYFLKEIDFTSFNTGSAVPSLNRNHIHSLKVKTPPLPEQKAIAAVLSSLDDKIDLLHRQNATLEAMAEALFRQWFVVEAKEEWEDITVADVAILNQQTKNKDYPYPAIQYLDTGSLTEGVIEGFQSYPFNDAPSRAQRLVNHNDILISLVRPNQKHYGIIKNPPSNLVVSTGFCVLTCKYMNPYFLYLFLTSNEMTEFLHSVAEGSTSAYPALISSDIAKLELKRPPADKLVEFGNYADSAWEKITQNQTQIRTLEKFRDTLLPKLMSGEVRVAC
jgi:type I restriction enzyme S subunit